MSTQFQGKVALVTGGNSGIGFATARRLAAEGARVIITGRRPAEVAAAARELGENVTGLVADVANLPELEKLFGEVRQRFDHIDILFANAGTAAFAPLGDIAETHYDTLFDTNVKGLLFTVQYALPLLRPGSSIILNASIVSIKANPGFSVYSATKAAVRALARNWALDLKGKGIRVNVVSPGVVPTPGYRHLGINNQSEQDAFIAQMTPGIPLERAGTTDEIAGAVLFLASSDASYVNGIELFVDGGYSQI